MVNPVQRGSSTDLLWEDVWTLNSFLCVLIPKKSAGREFNTD